MSHLLELAGFGLLTAAFGHWFGAGGAYTAGGASLLIAAQGVNDGAVKAAALRIIRRKR